MTRVELNGIDCLEIANEHLSLLATISVGPRILSLKASAGENLFAVLPQATLDCPGAGLFHFYGGHRLWCAPEDPCTTYQPDDRPVRFEPIEDGVRLIQDAQPRAPLEKTLEIRLASGSPKVLVRHVLANRGADSHCLAPWAITQFRPGGVAVLPQATRWADNKLVLPNRSIALWPYTDLKSGFIDLGNEAILVHATMKEGMLKIGFPNPAGWMAYWIDDSLFVKRAAFHPGAEYLDLGSSSECYCDPRFLELETLGPAVQLHPGSSVEHVEAWTVHQDVRWTDDLAEIRSAVAEG
jgi:hypothetical protein